MLRRRTVVGTVLDEPILLGGNDFMVMTRPSTEGLQPGREPIIAIGAPGDGRKGDSHGFFGMRNGFDRRSDNSGCRGAWRCLDGGGDDGKDLGRGGGDGGPDDVTDEGGSRVNAEALDGSFD